MVFIRLKDALIDCDVVINVNYIFSIEESAKFSDAHADYVECRKIKMLASDHMVDFYVADTLDEICEAIAGATDEE